jgi:hypothetical protein
MGYLRFTNLIICLNGLLNLAFFKRLKLQGKLWLVLQKDVTGMS